MSLNRCQPVPRPPRHLFAALVAILCLAVGGAQAADKGPLRHAEGTFDAASGAYRVVRGDDLDAIAERFGVTAKELKEANRLQSNQIEIGQRLVIAAGAEGAMAGVAQPRAGAVGGLHPGGAASLPGAPNATTTIDGRQLPSPPPEFGGFIQERAEGSIPWWPPRVAPPKGAPNVLLILTDDAGYGVSGTFGGVIPTPALDRIANAGLRYTQFHSTALCSPSRAALITGRNHHDVGFGIADAYTGYPGYDAVIGLDNATVGRILKGNGYATSWFGKNHNTDPADYSSAGPFDQWPTGMGFDYFYGFMAGESDQWTPYLFRNTTQIFPWRDEANYQQVTAAAGRAALDPTQPYPDQPSWNLVTAMADDAIRHMKELDAANPDQPFFIYYAPGATHAPHQPKQEWSDKFKGKFDLGWNKMREVIFENQKKLGVIPPDTQLTPWPDDLPQWDSLKPDEKRMFARQAENFAGYVAYADHEIGRVIQAVEDLGKLDNTLIVYIEGDNGTSAEGTTIGTYNDLAAFQGAHISSSKFTPIVL